MAFHNDHILVGEFTLLPTMAIGPLLLFSFDRPLMNEEWRYWEPRFQPEAISLMFEKRKTEK